MSAIPTDYLLASQHEGSGTVLVMLYSPAAHGGWPLPMGGYTDQIVYNIHGEVPTLVPNMKALGQMGLPFTDPQFSRK